MRIVCVRIGASAGILRKLAGVNEATLSSAWCANVPFFCSAWITEKSMT